MFWCPGRTLELHFLLDKIYNQKEHALVPLPHGLPPGTAAALTPDPLSYGSRLHMTQAQAHAHAHAQAHALAMTHLSTAHYQPSIAPSRTATPSSSSSSSSGSSDGKSSPAGSSTASSAAASKTLSLNPVLATILLMLRRVHAAWRASDGRADMRELLAHFTAYDRAHRSEDDDDVTDYPPPIAPAPSSPNGSKQRSARSAAGRASGWFARSQPSKASRDSFSE